MVNIDAIISRFRPVISEHKQQHTDICESCAGIMQSRDGFLQCLVCGVQKGRTSDSFGPGFDCWREFSGAYTRRYRFMNLLKDLNGWGNFPEECVESVWTHREEIKTCQDAKKFLTSDKIFRKHQNQVSTVMRICGYEIPSLDCHEMQTCCKLFTMVDMRIGQYGKQRAAFTHLLPVILRLIGRQDWELGGYLKKVSPLLLKKYGKATQEAIGSLNLCSSKAKNSKEIQ